MPFGSHLGHLEAFLRGLYSQKPSKTNWFFKVFVNEGFLFFEAPDGSYGLILALLGRSDPKLGSKMSSNIFLKSGKKMCKNVKNNVQIWVGKLGPESVKNEIAGLRHFLPRHAFFDFFLSDFCMAFWRFLGVSWAALGPLEGLMGGLWTQKH